MKIVYEQKYVSGIDITIIMKSVYDTDDIMDYTLCGYYFGEPSIEGLETFKDSMINKYKEK